MKQGKVIDDDFYNLWESKQRSVLDAENVTRTKSKSKRTYQLSSGTDSGPENSGVLSTEQKTKKKRKMATDNLELSDNDSESEMSESSEGVAIISSFKEESLGIPDVEDASSLGQKTLVMNNFKKLGILLNRMIGIGFDNASVNTGAPARLGALPTTGSPGGGNVDDQPELFVLGCTSHSLALVASHASE
ncbi:hypothetical protein QYM36_002703 [Artemia franciscana]|uniref:Uncharacterized protein n=1 Tax=Artemia franciscana TaxID=6661 RepID=A0AA88I979_ARTSF|nr:hypothetical protein QYM36_002703 [Artemia franciscana]